MGAAKAAPEHVNTERIYQENDCESILLKRWNEGRAIPDSQPEAGNPLDLRQIVYTHQQNRLPPIDLQLPHRE